MPAYIPWPDSAEIVIHWTLFGVPVSITLAATKPGGFNSSEQSAVTANVDNWVTAALQPHLSSQLKYLGITTTDKRTSTGPVFSLTQATPVNGGNANPSIQINSAMVMSPRTPNRGRSGRGRKYIPGIPETFLLDATEFDPTDVATIAGDFGSLDSNMNLSGFSWTVPSEITGGVPRTNALMQEVTGLVNGTPIGSRRKRGLWS